MLFTKIFSLYQIRKFHCLDCGKNELIIHEVPCSPNKGKYELNGPLSDNQQFYISQFVKSMEFSEFDLFALCIRNGNRGMRNEREISPMSEDRSDPKNLCTKRETVKLFCGFPQSDLDRFISGIARNCLCLISYRLNTIFSPVSAQDPFYG